MLLPEVLVSFADSANHKYDRTMGMLCKRFCIPCCVVASFLHGLLLNMIFKLPQGRKVHGEQ